MYVTPLTCYIRCKTQLYNFSLDKEDRWRLVFREVDANSDNVLEALEIDNMALSKLLEKLIVPNKDEL